MDSIPQLQHNEKKFYTDGVLQGKDLDEKKIIPRKSTYLKILKFRESFYYYYFFP
jgi:hypothetical protein